MIYTKGGNINMVIKVLHLSDLHLDVNEKILERSLLGDLVDYLNVQPYNLLLISGDLSGDVDSTLWYLDEIERRTEKKVLFVPGNHDIWVGNNENSWDSLIKLKKHKSNILNNPYLVGNWAIVGGFSWYDYSYRMNEVSEDDAKYKKKQFWQDAKYAKFDMCDIDITNKMLEEIYIDLEKVKGKKVWLMNHFVPYEDFITYKMDWIWNFCSAYIGTEKLGKLIDDYNNIEIISFGHTHTRYENRLKGNKKVVCNPLGYVGEWKTLDFINELNSCAEFHELT
jgi:putative phosphoesterase